MQPKPEHFEVSFCSAAPSTGAAGVDEELGDADFPAESSVVSFEDSDAELSIGVTDGFFEDSSSRCGKLDESDEPESGDPKSDSVSGRIFSMNQARNV